MNKVIVFLDLDIVIRAFVLSDVFKKLHEKNEIFYVFYKDADSSNKKWRVNVKLEDLQIDNVIEIEMPRKREGFWYHLYVPTVLKLQKGKKNYRILKELKFKKEVGSRNLLIYDFLSLPLVYIVFKYIYEKYMGLYKPLENLINEISPDCVIYPSVLGGPFMNDLIKIAKIKKIPSIVCMNSWDNPTSKAICTSVPDKLVVWGEQSKRDSIEYMGMPEENIEIFGAAQFQVYRKEPKETIDELCEIFEIPKNKKVILYAGINTSHYETQYLKMLDEYIESEGMNDYHILYRPHPWRGGLGEGEENYFDIKWKNISMDPHLIDYYKKQMETPKRNLFMIDYEISNKILTVSDAVISPRSTFLLESVIKGKPILVFFPEELENKNFSIEEANINDFIKNDLINVCLKKNELFNEFRNLCSQVRSDKTSLSLKNYAEKFCVMGNDDYGVRLSRLVSDLCRTK